MPCSAKWSSGLFFKQDILAGSSPAHGTNFMGKGKLKFLGQEVEITKEKQCRRSADDHIVLVHQARAERMEMGMNVEESYVICARCGMGLSLNI